METPSYDAAAADAGESALMAALDREVRLGAVADRVHRRHRADWLWRGLAAVVVAIAGVAAWIGFLAPTETRVDPRGTRPTGEETVLPAPEIAEGPPAGSASPGASAAATPTPTQPAPMAAGLGSGASLTTAPPAGGKKFRVHVASFRSEEKVAPIVRDLRLKGLDAWYEAASDAPGWYRVFVGRFATEDEAKAYATWLLQNKWVERAHAFPSTSR
jgi:cell division septation protein DedD